MDKNSFILYNEYKEQFELLSYEEAGKLIMAIFEYTETGGSPELEGMTKMAFLFIRNDLDRASAKYQKAVESGKLGGAPKGNQNAKQTKKTERSIENNQKQPTLDLKTTDTKSGLNQNNLNEDVNVNDNELNKRVPNGTPKETPDTLMEQYGFSEPLASGVNRWLKYKAERRDSYKDTGLKALLSRIDNKAKEYGDTAIIELIDECMSNGWKGLVWDKLDRAGKSPPSATSSKKDKFNFEQRDWDFEELERIKREELLKNSNSEAGP